MKSEDFKRLLKRMSPDVRLLNVDKLTDLSIDPFAAGRRGGGDAGSLKFTALWAVLVPEYRLVPEFRFHTTRRWRFDWAYPEAKVAVEYNGGVWDGGRHTRGKGYLGDREKINTALSLGWAVFELGTGMITPANIQLVAASIKERLDAPPRPQDPA